MAFVIFRANDAKNVSLLETFDRCVLQCRLLYLKFSGFLDLSEPNIADVAFQIFD